MPGAILVLDRRSRRIKTNDVILPTSAGRHFRIRCVTKGDESQPILLSRLGLTLPARLGEPTWETPNSIL